MAENYGKMKLQKSKNIKKGHIQGRIDKFCQNRTTMFQLKQNIAEKKKNGLLGEIKAPVTPPQQPAGAGGISQEKVFAVGFQNSNRVQTQGRGFRRGNCGRGGPPRGQHSFPGSAGGASTRVAQGASQRGGKAGGGTIQKYTFCIYCYKKYHKQEEYRSIIRDNAHCYSATGSAYYPKTIGSAKEEESVGSVQEIESVFYHLAS